MIPIYVGFDPRESVAYHVFCQSVLEQASVPVCFIPLAQRLLRMDGRRDGSNDFIYSRFLVPYLAGFSGWAIYADGDMVCRADIAELWAERDAWSAVKVVQHDYQTRAARKYLGNNNTDYPRKNWSSLILWNCRHFGNRGLTPEWVANQSGSTLHQFRWLEDERIGALPAEWNWLVGEYPANNSAKILHYTLGGPYFKEYAGCDHAQDWHQAHKAAQVPITAENNKMPINLGKTR